MKKNLTTTFHPQSPERLANGERIVKGMKSNLLVLNVPPIPTHYVPLGHGGDHHQQWINSVFDVMNYIKKERKSEFVWNNDWNELRSFRMSVKQRKAA